MPERVGGFHWGTDAARRRLRRRHRTEHLFRAGGLFAVLVSAGALATLLYGIGSGGFSAFRLTSVRLDVFYDREALGVGESDTVGPSADLGAVLRAALREAFPDASSRSDVRALQSLVSSGARTVLLHRLQAEPALIGKRESVWLPVADDVAAAVRGRADSGSGGSPITEQQAQWIASLEQRGELRTEWSTAFLTAGDSREPELAGIGGALVGSALTLLVTLLVSFPLGVSAAIYLEEFAPDNPWTRRIEMNINNLAAVPSIVFGLLGLAAFLGFFRLPRSAALVGGLTLALMTMPTIIIASRASIQAVPRWIREAARGLGASPLQVVVHHVLPLALPGVVTGTLLGMARALGETAPLLMIGMVAFIVDVPGGFTDAATALPVQIFLWADSPERGFVEKVSGAIVVLLALLAIMTGAAIVLRQRFEKRW